MANLRTNNLSGEQGQNAIRGAVNFGGYVDGSASDYLSVADHDDLNMGTGEFTFECWLLAVPHAGASYNPNYMGIASSQNYTTDGFLIQVANDGQLRLVGPLSGGGYFDQSAGPSLFNHWNHVAVVRTSGTIKGFVNGIEVISASQGTTIDFSLGGSFNIGENGYSQYPGDYPLRGTISNLRLTKGLARYTSTFIPPAFELTADADTVLLCCQNSDDVTQEETGKTITGVGNLATAGYNKTQPKVIPPYGVDAGNTFGGSIQQSSQGYMYFPTGRTEERGRGRGVYGGGGISSPTNPANISYINVQSQGNTTRFGSLTTSNRTWTHGYGSSTRAIWSNGGDTGGAGGNLSNVIDFVTIATTGDAIDFGDSTINNTWRGGLSNSIRGITGGGGPSAVNTIDFIIIANLGDATDFGDLTQARRGVGAMASSTRGVFAGGVTPSYVNIMDFVTIATTGNASDFGDMTQASRHDSGGCSSGTRGIIGGGQTPTALNTIQFITIASTGDASDFGDLQQTQVACGTLDNSIRGVFSGSYSPMINTMSFITIATTGNSSDFGDNTDANYAMGGTSDSHGGLS